MGKAKQITLKFIDSKSACQFVKKNHYSGKVAPNSQINIGVFFKNKLEGVLQYGPSISKRRMIPLVKETRWNGFIELNRMAFSDVLPKNSESRALAISFKMLKKHYPFIEWIVSFSDACQCGDGTIYRASGFVLTQIKKNVDMLKIPNGEVVATKTFAHSPIKYYKGFHISEGVPLKGFQLRYIYFLNKDARKRLTVAEIPFSRINEVGASMYKGKAGAHQSD